MTANRQDWQYPGARWWKFDFHAHTPASRDTGWYGISDPNERLTPEGWLRRYMEAEVDCVAITDHNTGEWIDRLKAAYARLRNEPPNWFREIHLFPGVEISVNGGIHLLAIFDPCRETAHISDLLARAEYDGNRGDSDGVTRKSLPEVVELVTKAGGLAIPAHADQEKGLLRLHQGGTDIAAVDANTLRQVLGLDLILAMEWVDRNRDKPQVYKEAKVRWTEVLGSDCHNFRTGHQPGERFTWVKMAKPSLEGLRLALHDGAGLSVRRGDEPGALPPNQIPEHVIESIEISWARYMGRGKPERLEFNPWFNALIGGRGTGKSTIVHALRLVYRRDEELTKILSEEDPVRKTFEQFIRAPRGRLDPIGALDYQSSRKTRISVVVRTGQLRRKLHWSQADNGAAVEIEQTPGAGWAADPTQVISPERFPVRIFSQGQIASLAGESHQALLALIDEAARTGDAKRRLEEESRKFFALRAQLRELGQRLRRKPEILARLEDLGRKLQVFEQGQHADVLKEYQLRQRQNREMDRQLEDVARLAQQLRKEAEKLVLSEPPPGLFEPERELDGEPLAIVTTLQRAVQSAAEGIQRIADGLDEAAAAGRQQMQDSEWFLRSVAARVRYEEFRSRLSEQGVSDPGLYGRLVQERQALEDERKKVEELERKMEALRQECEKQREHILELRRQVTQLRAGFITRTLQDNLYVRITLVPYGNDPRRMERELREVLDVRDDRFESDILTMDGDTPQSGIVADLLARLPPDPDKRAEQVEQRLGQLVHRIERAAQGRGNFGGHFNNYLKKRAETSPELIDRISVWFPEDSLTVECSPKGDGKDFRSIAQASAGQRAAALLALLLSYGEEPLVLDQPEDDLDNHLIYELVVQQIRANKARRQLIIVTHNPNVVVNGDAEYVHAFDFSGGQCRVVKSGCLQERPVRDEVCKVMEGGREAFERRFYRIGKEV